MSSEVSLDGRERGCARRALGFCARAACSQLGLVVLVMVYVVLGALMFEYLESGPEVQKRSAIQRSREECLKELWAITVSECNSSVENYYSNYEDDPEASASDNSNAEEVKSVVTVVGPSVNHQVIPTTSQAVTPGRVAETSASVPDAPPIELPANILEALGGSKEKEEIFGPKIPEEIAKRWGRIVVEGLGKEQKEELMEKFLVPENFKLLKAPKLNAEIAAVMSESSRQRDKRMEKAQNHLGLAIAGLSKLAGSLISEEVDKLAIIKQIADISQLLADLHSENTNSRRKIILPSLDKKFTNMMQDVKRDSYLFGENLGEKIKASKTAEKSGLQIKRSYTATSSTSKKYTSRQGNWKAPPRHQGSRTNKPGGNRPRAPPQFPRRTTSERYQPPSSKRDNRQPRKHQ